MILFILATIISVIPIILIKEFLRSGKYIYIGLSVISYLSLLYVYVLLFSQSKKDVSSIYVILQILQILIVMLFGIFFLKEKYNYVKILGIFLGILSISILSY